MPNSPYLCQISAIKTGQTDVTNSKRCPQMYAFNTDARLIAVRCGSWYCPKCMKTNSLQWSWRVRLHIGARHGPAYFWTLTMRAKYKTPQQAYAALPGLWDRFRKYIKRLHPGKWEYVAFVEGQPKRVDMPHFHIISLIKSPKRLKDIAVWAGFGYQAYEKKVTSDKAAWYVAKYASKQSPSCPRGFRRVRASRGWTALPKKDGASLIVRAADESLQRYLERVASETGVPLDDVLQTWLHKETPFDYWDRDIDQPEIS